MTYDSDPTLDALMTDDPIPPPPYINLDDLLLILTHLGDNLSVDGQRWLLRLLRDAFDELHDRKASSGCMAAAVRTPNAIDGRPRTKLANEKRNSMNCICMP